MEVQKTFLNLGLYGCYFFCLWKIVEKFNGVRYHDPLLMFERAFERGDIREGCYVLRPDEILRRETGRKWEVRKEGADYQKMAGEVVVLRYERKVENGGDTSHFVLETEDGIWDPLGESLTVKYGKVVSKRVFREV